MPPCDPARHRRHGRARRDGSGDRARRLMLRRGRECGDAAMMLVRFGVRLRPRSRSRTRPGARRSCDERWRTRDRTSDERAPPRKAVRACTRTVNEGAPRVRGSLAKAVRSLASATRSPRSAADGGTARHANPSHRPTSSGSATPTMRWPGGPPGRISTTTRSLGTHPFQSVWDVSTRDARAREPAGTFLLGASRVAAMRAPSTDGRSSPRRWMFRDRDVDVPHRRGVAARCGARRLRRRGSRRQHREGRRVDRRCRQATSSWTRVPGSSAARCSCRRRPWSGSTSTPGPSSSTGRRKRSRTLPSSTRSGIDPTYQDELGGYYGRYYS